MWPNTLLTYILRYTNLTIWLSYTIQVNARLLYFRTTISIHSALYNVDCLTVHPTTLRCTDEDDLIFTIERTEAKVAC